MNDRLLNATINNGSTLDSTDTPSSSGVFVEPAPMRWTLRIIFVLVFLVGMVGNSVVCAAVIRRKRMRTSNNIFTFNLAFSDLLTVVIYVPSQMAAFENNHNWLLGDFACHLTYITIPVCMSASIMTLLAITLDRYRAIANPLRARLKMRTVKIILTGIWITSFLIVLPLVFVAGEVSPAPDKVYCDETWPEGPWSKIYWIFIFAIQYVLPLAIIVVLAILIALKIRQNSAEMLKSSNQLLAAARQRMRQTSKITNMLIALVILYAVCMLPQHVVYFWLVYGDLGKSKYFVYVLRFSNVFPMANSAFNPFAYGLNKEFKQAFQSFFKCGCNERESLQVNGVKSFHRTAGRRFQHSTVYGERTMLQRWRRGSSATSLLNRSEKTSLWKKKRRNEKLEGNKSNGVVLRRVTVPSGEDRQNSPLLEINDSSEKRRKQVAIIKKPVNDVASVALQTTRTSRNSVPRETMVTPTENSTSYRGLSEDEMTSLLCRYEARPGRRLSDKQNTCQDRDRNDTVPENSGPKSSHQSVYLDGTLKASPGAEGNLLPKGIVASSVKLTLNKPDEELVKFIQSLEETNV